MAVDKHTGSTQLAVEPHWSSSSGPRSSAHSAPPRHSTLLTKPETPWPPPPSLPYVPITISGLRSTAPMASTSLSMDVVLSKEQLERRPATARAVVARPARSASPPRPPSGRPATAQLGVPASPRSGSAEWRVHTPRTPAPTRPAGPRTTRAPRCEASSSSSSTAPAVATLGEAPGQPELSTLLAELRRAPMHSEIPPRWRIFEAAAPTRGGAAGVS